MVKRNLSLPKFDLHTAFSDSTKPATPIEQVNTNKMYVDCWNSDDRIERAIKISNGPG